MARPVSNPPDPWRTTVVEWLGEPPRARLEVWEEDARSILSANESPDVPFRWSVNPYRGCQHACAYCYARPGHPYLGFGAGTDFDTKIVVKRNAPELLRAAFARRTWKREGVAFSGVTDCYQPLEASYELTRRCLEACAEFRNPVTVLTKAALVRRDVDVLARIAGRADARVFLSIPFSDPGMGRRIEPSASSPQDRLDALSALADAGVPTGVAVAPIIPGLNEDQIPEILERARAAGARWAFRILLRLPGESRAVFEERLRASYPDRADKVLSALASMQRPGARFGERMEGRGPRWETTAALFDVTCRRLGLEHRGAGPARAAVPRRPVERQQGLFD